MVDEPKLAPDEEDRTPVVVALGALGLDDPRDQESILRVTRHIHSPPSPVESEGAALIGLGIRAA